MGPAERLLRARLDPEVAAHLIRLYGEDAPRVAAYGDGASGALDRIDPRGPDIWAQVDYARDEESAVTVDDVLARRTTLAVRGLVSSGPIAEAVRDRLRTPHPELVFPATIGVGVHRRTVPDPEGA